MCFPHPAVHPKETMQVLQAKVNILDMAVLDQVEARLQVRWDGRRELCGGCHRAVVGALTKAVKSRVSVAGFGVSLLLPSHQSVLGKVNEIAKHKATVQDADTQSKVRAGGEDPLKATPA